MNEGNSVPARHAVEGVEPRVIGSPASVRGGRSPAPGRRRTSAPPPVASSRKWTRRLIQSLRPAISCSISRVGLQVTHGCLPGTVSADLALREQVDLDLPEKLLRELLSNEILVLKRNHLKCLSVVVPLVVNSRRPPHQPQPLRRSQHRQHRKHPQGPRYHIRIVDQASDDQRDSQHGDARPLG